MLMHATEQKLLLKHMIFSYFLTAPNIPQDRVTIARKVELLLDSLLDIEL